MSKTGKFSLNAGWRVLITDLGLDPETVLRLARLPADLFSREAATLTPEEYFALWRAVDAAAEGFSLPLKVGQVVSVEVFDPPIFASFCSPDLNTALQRLRKYKTLVGPLAMEVEIGNHQTRVGIRCVAAEVEMPPALILSELVFFTALARMATRKQIEPVEFTCHVLPDELDEYEAFLGVRPKSGKDNHVSFSARDAQRPFLTENRTMWQCFEPELQQRLSELETAASATEKVRSVLLEMLPSGESSIDEAAIRLGIGKRTIQRRLSEDGESFQSVLQATRQSLARHYLSTSTLSFGEISFLLGFHDTNSFTRAYTSWTGQSPGNYRRSITH